MKIRFPLVLSATFLFAACSSEPGKEQKKKNGGADPGHGQEHTERTALGDVKVGDFTIAVFQLSKVQAGHEGDFDLDFAAGQALPDTLRGWVGIESGQGSAKVRFGKVSATRMHGHPEVPDPLPADSKLWLEVETPTGTQKASVALK